MYKLYPTGDNLADQHNFAQPEDNLVEPVHNLAENPKAWLTTKYHHIIEWLRLGTQLKTMKTTIGPLVVLFLFSSNKIYLPGG